MKELTLILPIILSACASKAEFLAKNAFPAVYTTESRARQDYNCPDVTAFILSKAMVSTETGWYNKQAKYTIGTRGCGKQAIYFTLCRDPNNCHSQSKTERQNDITQ